MSWYPETCLAAFCPWSLLRRPGMPTCVVPMVPGRAQVRDSNILGAHHQSNKELLREGMKGSLRNHGPSSFRNFDVQRMSTSDDGTFSQRFSAKSRAAHLPRRLHESTNAVWRWSLQLPAIVIPSQASVTDLFKGPVRDAFQQWHHAPRRPL